jgi:hypothetical protein
MIDIVAVSVELFPNSKPDYTEASMLLHDYEFWLNQRRIDFFLKHTSGSTMPTHVVLDPESAVVFRLRFGI